MELVVAAIVEPVLWSALGLLSGGTLYATWTDASSSSEKEDSANVRKFDDVTDLMRGGPTRRAQIHSKQRSRYVAFDAPDCNQSVALDKPIKRYVALVARDCNQSVALD